MNRTVLVSFIILCLLSIVSVLVPKVSIVKSKPSGKVASGSKFIPIGVNETLVDLALSPNESLNFIYTLNATMRIGIFVTIKTWSYGYLYVKWDGTLPTSEDFDDYDSGGGTTIFVFSRKGLPPGAYYFMVFVEDAATFDVTLNGYYCVHNLNTSLSYPTIQEAINANETLNGHTIFVEAGTYYENVIVNKTVSIIGESKATTLINGNKTAEAVIITANNTLLSGFTIQSGAPFIVAVRLENVSHTTITNNTITNSFSGLAVAFSDSNLIAGNNITKNTFRDALVNSSNNVLRDNTMEGLYISKSINNTLVGNTIGSFMLSYSPDTTLRNNSFSVFGVYGDKLSDFVQAIDSSNTVNGKPIYYWVNHENAEVPSDAGYVALINCANVTVRGLNFENNFQSILMFSTNNSRILNNNVTNINEGIWIFSSSNNIIYGNNITYSCIQLLNGCSNNNIHNNNITTSGILLSQSSNNNIFHNNFINALVNSYKSTNTWEGGYPSGGNYWSIYDGTDLFSGSYQNVTGSDGIGDTSYVIDENNVDNYPLMGPFNSFNTSVGYSVDVISNSTIEDFRYFESNNTIVMHVSNMTANQTVGFCRLTIPHELIAPPYNITVNNTPVKYNTILENETLSIIYFSYEHSQIEIIIVPEYSSTMLLLMLPIITAIVTTLKRKRNLRFSK